MSACGHENRVEVVFEVTVGTLILRRCKDCNWIGARLNDTDVVWTRGLQPECRREADGKVNG